MSRRYFEESQKFTQPWLWLVFGVVAIATLTGISIAAYNQLVLDKPFGNNPAGDTELLIALSFTFLLLAAIFWLLLSVRLDTQIEGATIRYKFKPFINQWKQIKREEIEFAEVIKYSPLIQYGGWGYRLGIRGKALNIRGNMGLDLKFKNGKKLLIGTQKPDELKSALAKFLDNALML